MAEKQSFEDIYKQIEESIKKLEEGELSIDESITLHKKTMKKIELAKKMLNEMEAKIEEIRK